MKVDMSELLPTLVNEVRTIISANEDKKMAIVIIALPISEDGSVEHLAFGSTIADAKTLALVFQEMMENCMAIDGPVGRG